MFGLNWTHKQERSSLTGSIFNYEWLAKEGLKKQASYKYRSKWMLIIFLQPTIQQKRGRVLPVAQVE